jgi:hypothetical protein
MISDVMASVEVACMHSGLRFRTRWDILGNKSFHLSCTDGQVRPDELCAIEDTPLTLASRHVGFAPDQTVTR